MVSGEEDKAEKFLSRARRVLDINADKVDNILSGRERARRMVLPRYKRKTGQEVEAIALDIINGKGPSGEGLLDLAVGYLDAVERGLKAEAIIHNWIHDGEKGKVR